MYSWSVMQSGGNPGFEDRVLYVVLVVELSEQRVSSPLATLSAARPMTSRSTLPLAVTWEDVNDKITLPQWRPASAATTA